MAAGGEIDDAEAIVAQRNIAVRGNPGAAVVGPAMAHRSHHRGKVRLVEPAPGFTDPSADAAHALPVVLSLPLASGRTHEDDVVIVVHAVDAEAVYHVGRRKAALAQPPQDVLEQGLSTIESLRGALDDE